MTQHYSRRRAIQTAMTTAAVASIPLSKSAAAAQQATPAPVDGAAISADQVEFALSKLDGLIEAAMKRTGVPGAAVAVVYNDSVVYEKAFGIREVGKPDPVTPETVFQLASMSKPISTTLVAAVVGDGKTTWDAVATDLLPGFSLSNPLLNSQIALRDLFSHRSGLPAYAGDNLASTFGYGREESLHRLRFVEPATPLRTSYAYTNLPFSVAAYAAAETTEKAWEDLADERLFAPLGMETTSYRLADYMSRTNKAAPHFKTQEGIWALGEVTESDVSAPAGGISTNVHDLTQWMRLQLGTGMFEGTELVASTPLLETRRPQILVGTPPNPADGPASFYGLGWFLQYDERGRLVMSHIGDFSSGFRSGVSMLPAAGLGIVVLTNGWPNALSDGIPKSFFEIVERGTTTKDWIGIFEDQTAKGLAAVAGAAPFPRGGAPTDGPALAFNAYTGTYTNELLGDLTVKEADDGLVMEIGPHPISFPLEHWDRDVFTYPLPPSGAVLLGNNLGVQFMIGPSRKATTVAFGLPTVGADSSALFTRVE